MNRDELIDTIQRLISLSSSSNEHESAAALARANELMAKHNISMFDIETQKINAEYSTEEVYTTGRSSTTEPYLCDILQNYFFIKAVSYRDKKTKKTTLKFFGDKTNVEIARYVFKVLDLYFRVYADANHVAAKDRRVYYMGLTRGFKDKLKEEREILNRNSNNKNALVLIDKALVVAFQSRFQITGFKRTSKIGSSNFNSEVYNKGVEDGKEINLRKGLSGSNVPQPKIDCL